MEEIVLVPHRLIKGCRMPHGWDRFISLVQSYSQVYAFGLRINDTSGPGFHDLQPFFFWERLQCRIPSWKWKDMAFAGCVILLQFVPSSFPTSNKLIPLRLLETILGILGLQSRILRRSWNQLIDVEHWILFERLQSRINTSKFFKVATHVKEEAILGSLGENYNI